MREQSTTRPQSAPTPGHGVAGPPSRQVELDEATGRLRMGAADSRVGDPSDPDSVYGAYLSVLYAVRGQRRGEQIPLRSADLDALLAIVGEQPEVIEQRLIALMGCNPEDASLLRRALLRHRSLTASVGIAAGLSLVALLGPSAASAAPPSQPEVSVASLTDSAVPPLDSYATTDDGRHVAPPQDWADEPHAATPAPAAAAVPGPESEPAVVPASAAVPGPAPVPAPVPGLRGPVEPDVVLGTPMAPIDRPEPGTPEPDVMLGTPMAPIDRPEPGTPEPDVLLGTPMAPIDRPEPVGVVEPAPEQA